MSRISGGRPGNLVKLRGFVSSATGRLAWFAIAVRLVIWARRSRIELKSMKDRRVLISSIEALMFQLEVKDEGCAGE